MTKLVEQLKGLVAAKMALTFGMMLAAQSEQVKTIFFNLVEVEDEIEQVRKRIIELN